MPTPTFSERLQAVQRSTSSVLCVGLDPDLDRLPRHLTDGASPAEAVLTFHRAIIEATASVACAYKLNLAFFEALGAAGWEAIRSTLEAIPDDVLTIADGKRGDIGNSARFYARSTFEQLGFDACTVSGYMGEDSVTPFLQYSGRGVFLLARTSNPGATDFQEISCGEAPFFEHVVRTATKWDADLPGTLGFVAGATDIDALRRIRALAPTAPLLIPGIGAQGGDAGAVMRVAAALGAPVLINSSRSIIYASEGRDFAEAAAREAESLRSLLAGTDMLP
ncbi:MAG: orotidine-5'-phosphate decarboxylase [Rhodothermales bacterium]